MVGGKVRKCNPRRARVLPRQGSRSRRTALQSRPDGSGEPPYGSCPPQRGRGGKIVEETRCPPLSLAPVNACLLLKRTPRIVPTAPSGYTAGAGSFSDERFRRSCPTAFQVFRPIADEQPMTLDELDKLLREA